MVDNAEAFAKAAKAFNERVEACVLKRRELAQQSEQNDGNWVKQDKPVTTKKRSSINQNNSSHFTAGRSAFKRSEPKDLQATLQTQQEKNAKDWIKGWESARTESETRTTESAAKTEEKPKRP